MIGGEGEGASHDRDNGVAVQVLQVLCTSMASLFGSFFGVCYNVYTVEAREAVPRP